MNTRYLFGCVLAFFIISSAFMITFYSESTYSLDHAKLILGDRASDVFSDFMQYLKGTPFVYRQELLSDFTESEADHMKDVKILIDLLHVLWLASLASLWFYKEKEDLRRGGWIAIAAIATIAVFSLAAFDTFWNLFHAVLFPQGNWTFPPDSLLLILFPESFFQRFISLTVLWSLALSAIAIAVSYQSKFSRS